MPVMDDAADRAGRSARELARRIGPDHHDILVVLGSGLSVAGEILGAGGPSLPLDTLPYFPRYTAAGHRAEGWSVDIAGKRVLVFGGRCHLYEGIAPAEAVHPLLTGVAAGCATVILTAAVGGIRDDLTTGSVMVVEDHLNLTGLSPLDGPEFVDMVDAYSPAAERARPLGPGRRRCDRLSPPGCLRPGARTPVRDAGGDPHAVPLRRGRRRDVDGTRDDRRPPRRRRGPGPGTRHQPGRHGCGDARRSPLSRTSALPPRPPWPTSSATS